MGPRQIPIYGIPLLTFPRFEYTIFTITLYHMLDSLYKKGFDRIKYLTAMAQTM